jgi:hypothetical protein
MASLAPEIKKTIVKAIWGGLMVEYFKAEKL